MNIHVCVGLLLCNFLKKVKSEKKSPNMVNYYTCIIYSCIVLFCTFEDVSVDK